jgi:hypothetical protein
MQYMGAEALSTMIFSITTLSTTSENATHRITASSVMLTVVDVECLVFILFRWATSCRVVSPADAFAVAAVLAPARRLPGGRRQVAALVDHVPLEELEGAEPDGRLGDGPIHLGVNVSKLYSFFARAAD